ncbi:MAG: excinuclease ABC subunit UvrC [Defluviitaleaceae bacterium]|nr:excinuclease ABC subunit UvrC [Defluviitaleaceae bacterium]
MTIEQKLKNLPPEPGVYLMYDERGEVIYVGKARLLKNRVRQYFHDGKKDEKVLAMVKLIADFNYIITLSEKDAFALESSLVKKYDPKFNILLKDDKAAPYIRINLKEEFPSMQVVRKVKRDGAKYFGPYFGGIRVMDVVSIVRAAYKVRFCKGRFGSRECLNYHINLCLGPCHMGKRGSVISEFGGKDRVLREGAMIGGANYIVENTNGNTSYVTHGMGKMGEKAQKEKEIVFAEYANLYRDAVNKAVAFLSGRDADARLLLEERMKSAAGAEDFERAIGYREQLLMIEKMKERHVSSFSNLEDIDSFYLASDGINAAAAVNVVRGGRMTGVRVFYLGEISMGGSAEMLTSFIVQYYDGNEIPKKVNLGFDSSFEDEDFGGLSEYLSVVRGNKTIVGIPERGIMKKLVDMAGKNAEEHLNSGLDKFKREQDMTTGACERLGKLLGIENLKKLECYDVSNMAGEDVVASGVVFVNGVPNKSLYRRYKIKTVDGQDDYAAIREVMMRRFRIDKVREEGVPDLVVIDGGKGQLAAAWSAICDVILSSGNNISHIYSKNVVGLAKKDEIIHLVGGGQISLAKGDYVLRLLMRARDEAHRFANSYNRLLRGGKLGSILERIEGVGEVKRKKILASINFKEIKTLSVDGIVEKSGIDIKTAENIVEFFKKDS